jgi:hypothetical protein
MLEYLSPWIVSERQAVELAIERGTCDVECCLNKLETMRRNLTKAKSRLAEIDDEPRVTKKTIFPKGLRGC